MSQNSEEASRRAEEWLDQLDPAVLASPEADASDLRAIVAAAGAPQKATGEKLTEDELYDAVEQALSGGTTWLEIAAVLGISRQAAQRFLRQRQRWCPGGCGQSWEVSGPPGRMLRGFTTCGCGLGRHHYIECLRCGHVHSDPPCSGHRDVPGVRTAR